MASLMIGAVGAIPLQACNHVQTRRLHAIKTAAPLGLKPAFPQKLMAGFTRLPAPSPVSGARPTVMRAGKGKANYETVIPGPDLRIPVVLIGIAAALASNDNILGALPVGLLGGFLAFQAGRVKFVFDKEALEVVIGEEKLESENAFVGGRNRWKYSTFTNWEFWWPAFPVLVYFKETQTKPEGQIHFFPIIMVRTFVGADPLLPHHHGPHVCWGRSPSSPSSWSARLLGPIPFFPIIMVHTPGQLGSRHTQALDTPGQLGSKHTP
eukprot:jgi/Mesvir1/16247/Mv08498-RA.1